MNRLILNQPKPVLAPSVPGLEADSPANPKVPGGALPAAVSSGPRGGRAQGLQSNMMPVEQFDNLAGILQEESASTTLAARMQATLQRAGLRRPMRTSGKSEGGESSGLKENPELLEAAEKTVSALLVRNQREFEEDLEREHDALRRYVLLQSAKSLLETSNHGDDQKNALTVRIDDMLSNLTAKNRDAIRQALKDEQVASQMLHSVSKGGAHPSELRELRFLYGPHAKGVQQSPLTPYNLAKVLEKNFGAASFSEGLSSLRSKLSVDLRQGGAQALSGPRLWMSLADAQAFSMVQTCYSVTGDLRRDIAERARIMPRTTQAEMTLTMLSLGDKGKAFNLISEIIDNRTTPPLVKGIVFSLALQTVRKLPHKLWQERPAQRMELIDELQRYVHSANKGLPRAPSELERTEAQWRQQLMQKS